jgi:acid phosphatase family membrane protein YuiD
VYAGVERLLDNRAFVACFAAWLLAQSTKLLIDLVRERRFNPRSLVTAGGMPSAHSAIVVALATRVGLDMGLDSTEFALAAIIAAIVMYDAAGVRRAVSIQARILNRMLTEMRDAQRFNEKRLRELLGHTPFEVFVGALIGGLTAFGLG